MIGLEQDALFRQPCDEQVLGMRGWADIDNLDAPILVFDDESIIDCLEFQRLAVFGRFPDNCLVRRCADDCRALGFINWYAQDMIDSSSKTRIGDVERVGGVKWTIKDGIVYDARKLRTQIREMVRAAKEKEGIVPGPRPIATVTGDSTF